MSGEQKINFNDKFQYVGNQSYKPNPNYLKERKKIFTEILPIIFNQ
ncbi:MAG: hypothetical protein HeimC3_39220 [Candidatus Heimdallarchaeota archaeon LC_3]|nr:MAG: hypothetical protein HeimC3_39220 [Candidatus Heimdallarchaeota archaeon LC_3]